MLPASLGALNQLTLRGLDELRKLPDPVGLTSLERMTHGQCKKLKALPVSDEEEEDESEEGSDYSRYGPSSVGGSQFRLFLISFKRCFAY